MTESLIGLALMLVLAFLRLPIALAMGVVGIIGYAYMRDWSWAAAIATIVGCAGFGAICGSSIATAATFAKVAYPSMKKFGYSDALATGAIASGGTLGILIPPSTIMVIYGIMNGTSIGKLFAAGILPGILATVLLCLAVQYFVWRDPTS